ncbi:sensor histidine kinase [Kocuria sp. HSID16901]|uniref:sensor histidine kinase n=1 Tax=Kocuria sp. HSID16901 TaxID=2419505 RepID=UPI00066048BF|nr:sensor histidine kinase [Kocuria sp. HSID16901]RUQ23464.1 sensor histidine kinase [Kocuria sp. HSID16901]
MSRLPHFSISHAIQAGVWLIFLAFPIGSLLTRGNSTGWVISGLLVIALFAVVYVVGFGYARMFPTRRQYPWLILWYTMMALIALWIATFVGHWVFNLTPYFVAACMFTLPPAVGISASAVIMCASTLGLVRWAENGISLLYSAAGTMIGSIIIMIIATVARREETSRELRSRLAVSGEREKVARDVHDLLGHSLTVINLKAEVAAKLLETDPDGSRDEILEISRLSRVALSDVRSTVTRLRRPDFGGEVEAARRALETTGITADLPDAQAALQLPGVNASLFSWALREAVTNVVRHSGASHCRVIVTPEKLQVEDDGVGIRSDEGNGLAGLRARVEESGGTLLIGPLDPQRHSSSERDPGTRLLVTMTGDHKPLEAT